MKNFSTIRKQYVLRHSTKMLQCNLEKEKEGKINFYNLVDVVAIEEYHLDLHSKEVCLRSMVDWCLQPTHFGSSKVFILSQGFYQASPNRRLSATGVLEPGHSH